MAGARTVQRARSFFASVDPSTWVILLGILVRIDTALRFDPANGYDGPDHMRYTDLLAGGVIPRVGVDTWEAQHPLLFYSLALVLEKLGLGRSGGMVISLVAGIVRLFVADRIFRWLERGAPGACDRTSRPAEDRMSDWRGKAAELAPPLPSGARFIANTIHAFVPVGIRMDLFYSPESIAATLALSSVAAALSRRTVLSGIVLGLALLSKSSAVSAVPAVAYALSLGIDRRITMKGLLRVAAAMALGFVLLMYWAFDNVRAFHTPYPPAQIHYDDPLWQLPIFDRHSAQYYKPKLDYRELKYPFYTEPPLSMPNIIVFDTWGDYYNFLGRGEQHDASPEQAANGRALGPGKLRIEVAFAHLGVILFLVLAAGMAGAAWRFVTGNMPRVEIAVAILGAGYIAIMVSYAIWHAYEHEGPVKACYALGASTILSLWTARPLARISGNPVGRVLVALLLIAVAALDVALGIVW